VRFVFKPATPWGRAIAFQLFRQGLGQGLGGEDFAAVKKSSPLGATL
jgi:hypothetical protein